MSGEQMQRLHDQCDKGDGKWDFDEIDGYDELAYVAPKLQESQANKL